MRTKFSRVLILAIFVFALAPIAASANYKEIPRSESNFQYLGEVTLAKYMYMDQSLGIRHLINIYGSPIGQLHHHRSLGVDFWTDAGPGETFRAVEILNFKKVWLKISSKGALDFVRTRYFGAVDYIPFDGEWVKSGEKLKCFVFDGVYENLSRVLGWFCRRQGPSFNKSSVTDFFKKLRYSDDGFSDASNIGDLKPTKAAPAKEAPAVPVAPANTASVEDRLRAVKRLLDEGSITEDEAKQKRREIIEKM